MKKSIIFIVCLLMLSPAAAAAGLRVGDPIGDVFHTDIAAYINGERIQTYYADGKVLVAAENLSSYGFEVVWDGAARTLSIEFDSEKAVDVPFPPENGQPGAPACRYYFTDIQVYLSGELIVGYAVDGVTLIDFELLSEYGILTWDGYYRELRLNIIDLRVTPHGC